MGLGPTSKIRLIVNVEDETWNQDLNRAIVNTYDDQDITTPERVANHMGIDDEELGIGQLQQFYDDGFIEILD